MSNIHTFDEKTIESLKDMLYSSDADSNRVAVEILKNADLNDNATFDFVNGLVNKSTVETYNQNSETMKSITEVLTSFIEKGVFTFPEYSCNKDKEARTDITLLETAIIEYKFAIRKTLDKEWLEEGTSDARKLEIEDEINVLNRYVANMMNVSYEDRH